MRNTLRTNWQSLEPTTEGVAAAASPRGRILGLGCAMALCLSIIAGRLAYVQWALPLGLVEAFDETTESLEQIPARDGRILSADGVTLADSDERIDLFVYYRWIEDPPNQDWLAHHARRKLNRTERKDRVRREAAEAEFLERRELFWRQLAELTGVSTQELSERRSRIQHRVDRIWHRVNDRRTPGKPAEAAPLSVWSRFWHELTTPPPRNTLDPLVISEQEEEHLLLENLDPEIAAEIETHPERYPGTRILRKSRRVYPQGDLTAHLIGSRTPLKPEELVEGTELRVEGQNRSSADPRLSTLNSQPFAGESVGRSGLERSYDTRLRGQPGVKRIVRNRRREVVSTEIVREPRHGQDLVLTFDSSLQRLTEALLDQVLSQPTETPASAVVDDESNRSEPPEGLGPRGACIVALDVHTGAVLAAAAAPRFDLNLLVDPDEARWQAVLDDPRRPMFPRVLQMALPPGSTFKTLSAIALLADGQLDPQARIICQGYLDRPDKDRCLVFRHYGVGHNETNLADALCRSCNVFFFTAARQAGPRPLIEWSQKLGIGQPTGIDVPGEAAGVLPSPERKGTSTRRWYRGDTLGLAIGQSSLLVTPLQMARLMAAVANDGQLVTPHLAAGFEQVRTSVESPGDATSGLPHPMPTPIAGLNHEILSAVREGLERVVQDPHGTAYKTVRLPQVKIAGKTGTAEVGGRRPDHAWFAGYVPADDPKVAFAVVIEHGGSGGKVAGPVAREFVKLLIQQRAIHESHEITKAP